MKIFLKENLRLYHIIVYLFLIFVESIPFINFENFDSLKDFEKIKFLMYLKIVIGYFPLIYFSILGFFIRRNIMKDSVNFQTYFFSIIMCSLLIFLIALPFIIMDIFLNVILSDLYQMNLNSSFNKINIAISIPFVIFLYGIYSIAIYKVNGNYKIKEAFYVFKKPILIKAILNITISFIIPLILQIINAQFIFSNTINMLIIIYYNFSILMNFYFTMYLVSYLNDSANASSEPDI